MKKVLVLSTAFVLIASCAFAGNFAPTLMSVSAPSTIKYEFDNKNLTIPVTVTGVAGSGSFMVFTKDKGASIGKVTNGYLGWHYVSKIDTCLYTSPFTQLDKGTTNITWNGKDEGGTAVAPGEYTYYIWAVDNVNPRVQVTKQVTFNPWGFRTIITHDNTGKALNQPIWYTGGANRNAKAETVVQTHSKWLVGGDPEDKALLETTTSPGWCAVGGIAFDPANPKNYFFNTLKEATGLKYTAKYEWVPNGASVLQTSWGDDGMVNYKTDASGGWNFGPGVVADGKDYLFGINADIGGTGKVSELIYMDVTDGSEIKRLDLTDWWTDVNEGGTAGGQYTGGPTEITLRGNFMGFGSHSTCTNQVINPYYEDEKDAVLWTNANGDYTGDHNFEATSTKKWICNDYNVGPYKYSVSFDSNMFMVFPSFDMGAVSFGLYSPDGTGMSYIALAGETAFQKSGVEFIDYGSAYDGLYTTSNIGRTSAGVDATIWFVGQDSIKGTITNQVGVKNTAPAAFAVSQNVPNPFNPTTTISFSLAKAGKTTVEVFNVAGQRVDTVLNASLGAGSHSVNWNAARHSAGVYFYTVKSGDFSKTMKMTLLK